MLTLFLARRTCDRDVQTLLHSRSFLAANGPWFHAVPQGQSPCLRSRCAASSVADGPWRWDQPLRLSVSVSTQADRWHHEGVQHAASSPAQTAQVRSAPAGFGNAGFNRASPQIDHGTKTSVAAKWNEEDLADVPFERVIGALCDHARRRRVPMAASWDAPPITRSFILSEHETPPEQRAVAPMVLNRPCAERGAQRAAERHQRHPPLASASFPASAGPFAGCGDIFDKFNYAATYAAATLISEAAERGGTDPLSPCRCALHAPSFPRLLPLDAFSGFAMRSIRV
jgi:hypothetical protein